MVANFIPLNDMYIDEIFEHNTLFLYIEQMLLGQYNSGVIRVNNCN